MSGGYDRWPEPAEPAWAAEPTTEWHPQFPGQRYPGDIGIEYLTPPAPRGRAVVGRAEVQPVSPAPGGPRDDAHPVSPASDDRRGAYPVSPAPGDRRGTYPVSPAPEDRRGTHPVGAAPDDRRGAYPVVPGGGDRRGTHPVDPAPGDRRGAYPVGPGGGDRRGAYPVIPGPDARRGAADGRGRDDHRGTPDGRERPAWPDRRDDVDAPYRRPRPDGRAEDGRTGDDAHRRGAAQPGERADHGPGRYDRRAPEWTVDRGRAAGWHGDRHDQPWGRPESGRRTLPPDGGAQRPVSPAPEPGWLPEPDEFPRRPHPADRRPDAPTRSERRWGTPPADGRPTAAPRGPADRPDQASDGPPPRERDPRRDVAARAETYRDAPAAPESDGLRRPTVDPHRPAPGRLAGQHGDPRPVGRPAAVTPDERRDSARPQDDPRSRPDAVDERADFPRRQGDPRPWSDERPAEQRGRTEPARYRPDDGPRSPAAPTGRPGPDDRTARPADPAPPGRDERRPAGPHPDGWQRHPAGETTARYDGRRPESGAPRPDDRHRPEDRPAYHRPEERQGHPAERGTARPADGWRPPAEPAARTRPDEAPSRPVDSPPNRHDDGRRPPVEPAARARPDDRPVAPTSAAPVSGGPAYPVSPADQPRPRDRAPQPAPPDEPTPTSAPPAAGLRLEFLPGPARTHGPAGPDADDDRAATRPAAGRHSGTHPDADAQARPAPPAYPGPAGPWRDEPGTRAEDGTRIPAAPRPVSAPPSPVSAPPARPVAPPAPESAPPALPAPVSAPPVAEPVAPAVPSAPRSTPPPATPPAEREDPAGPVPVDAAQAAPPGPVEEGEAWFGPSRPTPSSEPATPTVAAEQPVPAPRAEPDPAGPPRSAPPAYRPASAPPAYQPAPPAGQVSAPPAAQVSAPPAEQVSAPPAHSAQVAPARPISAPPASGPVPPAPTPAQAGGRHAGTAGTSAGSVPVSAAEGHPAPGPSVRPVSAPPGAPSTAPPAVPVSAPPAPASGSAAPVSAPPASASTPAEPASEAPAPADTSAQPGAGPAIPVSGPPAEPLTAAPAPESDTTAEAAEPAEPPAPDPEQALAAFRWRLDPETLREEATDPAELRVVRDGLTAKLGTALDNRSRARLLSLRSVASRILGDLDDALADGRLAVTYAEATGELRRTALARARLAQVLRWRGEHAEADRLFAEANSPELPDRLRAALHEHAGRSCLDQGRLIEACHHFERALDLRQGADPELVARTGVALDAVRERAAAGGFGPWPRDRVAMLRGERPPAPTFDEELEALGVRRRRGRPGDRPPVRRGAAVPRGTGLGTPSGGLPVGAD